MGAISLHIPSKVFVVHYRSLTLSHNNELSSAKEMEFACRRRQVTARGVLTDKPAGAEAEARKPRQLPNLFRYFA